MARVSLPRPFAIARRLSAGCVRVCLLYPALQANRPQITVNTCSSKVFKYFSISDELQLNLPPDGQKGGQVEKHKAEGGEDFIF